MSVLDVSDLSIRFGGLQALQDVSIQVNEFEIVGLIGPNGAGKTTAFNCITGFYKPDTGTVIYRGDDVTRVPPHKKAAMGFGRTFQNVGMVKSSTVLENLKTAQHARIEYDVSLGLLGALSVGREERDLAEKADAILELLGLEEVRNLRVGGLSYGTLKLLELGCALATEPDILLLDEPSSGMGPEEAHQLGERLIDLRQAFGLTMLLIEHHVPLVLSVCDHVYVLNFGRLLAEGPPSVIQTHPEVVAAYLGGEAPEALDATEETDEDAALDAQLGHHEAAAEPLVASEPDVLDDAPTEVIEVEPVEKPVRRTAAKAAQRKRGKTAAEQREEKALRKEPAATKATPRKRATR
jgi:branched-chain amino acid transport system ATP-binding protein